MPSDFLATVGGFIVYALALAVIPFLPLLIGSRLINAIEDARSPWTPFIELLALLIGALGGALVLAYNLPPMATVGRGDLSPGRPVGSDGGEFLGRWGNPVRLRLPPAVALAPCPVSGAAAGMLALLFGPRRWRRRSSPCRRPAR